MPTRSTLNECGTPLIVTGALDRRRSVAADRQRVPVVDDVEAFLRAAAGVLLDATG